MTMTNERKLLLLGLLRKTDMHGYMLNAHLDTTVPVTLKKPTAYHLLDVMEKDGWITHHTEQTGKRKRKVYRLTKQGDEAFLDLLRQQLSTFTPGEHPDMVSICFLDSLPPSEAVSLLKKRKSRIEDYIREAHGASGEDPATVKDHAGGLALAVDYIHQSVGLEMTFLDTVLRTLQDSEKPAI